LKSLGQYISEKNKSEICVICGTGSSLRLIKDLDLSKVDTFMLNGAIILPYEPPIPYDHLHGKWKWKPTCFLCIDKKIPEGYRCARSGEIFDYRADGTCPHCHRKNTCKCNYEFNYWQLAKASGANIVLAPWISIRENHVNLMRMDRCELPDTIGQNPWIPQYQGNLFNGSTVLMPSLHLAFLKKFKYIFLAGCDLSKRKLQGDEVERRFWYDEEFKAKFPWLASAKIKTSRDMEKNNRPDDADVLVKHFESYPDLKTGKFETQTIVMNEMYHSQIGAVTGAIRNIERFGIGVYKIGDKNSDLKGGALQIPVVDIEKFKQLIN